MADPTPEQVAMARRIAAHALCGPEKWKPGVKAGIYEEIMRGDADAEALVQGPLAAIIETTELAAKLVENWNRHPSTGLAHETSVNIAERLELGDHLKGQP